MTKFKAIPYYYVNSLEVSYESFIKQMPMKVKYHRKMSFFLKQQLDEQGRELFVEEHHLTTELDESQERRMMINVLNRKYPGIQD